MKHHTLLMTMGIFLLVQCSPEDSTKTKNWYKGNLHTHSYWSDGDEFPEVIMVWYKSHGYDFVSLTDHNILAEGEKWKVISTDSIYQTAFHNYLNEYGAEWVNHKTDSLGRRAVKLKTIEEYRPRFEKAEEFMIIQAEEISDQYNGKPLHLNVTNVQELINPMGGNSVTEVLQNNIDAVAKQRDSLGIPMIIHINHPNFGWAISLEDMIGLRDERFFEVYNGHPSVHNSGDSLRMSTEKMWDMINISYLQNNKPLMFGLATDDTHHYHVKGKTFSNSGRGWIMVNADSLNVSSIIVAMEAGDFYASTGVELSNISVQDDKIEVEVVEEDGVQYEISFIGCRKGQSEPEVFETNEGSQTSFNVEGDMMYARCKITSTKLHENPIEDLIYETAWTQPIAPSK